MDQVEYLRWVCERLFESAREETGRRQRITSQCVALFVMTCAAIGYVAEITAQDVVTSSGANIWLLVWILIGITFLLLVAVIRVRGIASMDLGILTDCDGTAAHDDFELRLRRVRDHLIEVIDGLRTQGTRMAGGRLWMIMCALSINALLGIILLSHMGQQQ